MLIYQGAESIVYLDKFENTQVIVKERIKKTYRIEQIDKELRKLRTRKEIKLLTEVRKLGIQTPKIFHVDEKNSKIVMEYINGIVIKDYLNSVIDLQVCFQLGEIIGKLHSNNIVHGDLTTSNMILKDGKIYLIDLSLGEFTQRIEDKAVDIKLLREALKSSHYKIFNKVWSSIVKGYKRDYENADIILNQMKKIEKRIRYINKE